jgi:hypothetical protein
LFRCLVCFIASFGGSVDACLFVCCFAGIVVNCALLFGCARRGACTVARGSVSTRRVPDEYPVSTPSVALVSARCPHWVPHGGLSVGHPLERPSKKSSHEWAERARSIIRTIIRSCSKKDQCSQCERCLIIVSLKAPLRTSAWTAGAHPHRYILPVEYL